VKRTTCAVAAVVILATGCGGGSNNGKVEGMVKRELVDEGVLDWATEGVMKCAESGDRRYDCHLTGSDAGEDCEYAVQVSEDEKRVVVNDVTKLSGAEARWSYCH
jgi:hypothetical protein